MLPRRWLQRKPAEWAVLAGVRFLMALAVVVYHLSIVRTTASVPLLDQLGGLGCICGFLAISGYSIAHSVTTQPRGFYARRAWRIMPTYYVGLVLAILPYWLPDPPHPFRIHFPDFKTSELVGSLFLVQNWITDKIPIYGPSWTLAIEWWFYVLAPLFIRLPNAVIAFIIVVSIVFQKVALENGMFPVHNYNWGIPAMMLLWAWLAGFLYYRARRYSAFLLVLVGYWAVNRFSDLSPAAYLIAALAVVVAKTLPRMPAVLARVLNYLGDLSYPLYLVHVPVIAWAGRWTEWRDPYAFIGISLAASALLYHAVDAPLRARFSSRAGRKPHPAPELSASLRSPPPPRPPSPPPPAPSDRSTPISAG